MAQLRNKINEDEQLKNSFNKDMMKRSSVYMKKEKFKFIQAITMQVLSILMTLVQPLIMAYTIDVVIPNKDMQGLAYCAVGLILAMIFNILFLTVSNRITAKIGQNIVYNIRKDLYQKLQELSFTYYDSRPHGKILVRVISYVNSVSALLVNGLIDALLRVMNLIMLIIFMLLLDVKLALTIFIGIPFVILIIKILQPMQRAGWEAFSNKSGNLNGYLNESIVGMKVTQLFNREEHNKGIFSGLIDEAKAAWYKAVRSAHAIGPSIEMISRVVMVLMLAVGVFYSKPAVSFGVLLAMMNYSSQLWSPILQLSNVYNTFINNIAYLERIFDTIDEPVEVHDKEDATILGDITGAVEFKNVNFSYEEGHPILKNVSFSIKPGESVALVGPTGAGKSSIINLISRFYNIDSGEILMDGENIADVTLESLRSQMGIMMQDSVIFSETINQNIRYGKLDATEEEIKAAAKVVAADVFIESLDEGYETMLSERGARLSQGQRQLVSFARTVVRDPKILILDEATSSLDTETERMLQDGLQKMMAGRTTFIVAHRLSTIRSCDKIMYIENGQILESGNHDELINLKGKYYQLTQK